MFTTDPPARIKGRFVDGKGRLTVEAGPYLDIFVIVASLFFPSFSVAVERGTHYRGGWLVFLYVTIRYCTYTY